MNIYTEYSLYILYICIHFILVSQLNCLTNKFNKQINCLTNILKIKYNYLKCIK